MSSTTIPLLRIIVFIVVLWETECVFPIEYTLVPNNQDIAPQIILRSDPNFESKGFESHLPTVMIVLDVGGRPTDEIASKLVKRIRSDGKFNIIITHLNTKLHEGDKELAQLVEDVAIDVSEFLRKLYKRYGAVLFETQLIGIGVGAQISGIAGRDLVSEGSPKLGHIVALSPSRDPNVLLNRDRQLNEDDAYFVVVYHTENLNPERMGFADIFVNTPKECSDIECTRNLSVDLFASLKPMMLCEGLPGVDDIGNWCKDSKSTFSPEGIGAFNRGIYKINA